jgi:transposase
MQQYELRNPANAARICALLSDGLSLRKVAKELGCSEAAIRQWEREDEAFASQYATARDRYHAVVAEQLIELADEAREDEPGKTNAYRLAIDTRKWVLSKVLPKKYGDKLINEHTGPDGSALNIIIKRFTPERE